LYFDKNDIAFLKSEDYKKYKKIQRWLSPDNYDELVTIVMPVIGGILLMIYTLKFFFDWFGPESPYHNTFLLSIVAWLSLGLFLALPISMFLSVLFYFIIVKPIIKRIVWKHVIKKQFTDTNNVYKIREKAIKEKILSYINIDHDLLISNLVKGTIRIERFKELKNEYIENYSFIKTASKLLNYMKGMNEFLIKGKEIIETITFHNLEIQNDFSIKNILAEANESFNAHNTNQQKTPLIDIIKKTLKEKESGETQTPFIEPQPQTLEFKIKEILSKEAETNILTKKPNIIRRTIHKVTKPKQINEEHRPEDSFERMINKNTQVDKVRNPSAPKTININASKINWADINSKKKSIGDEGELIVFNYEIGKLIKYDLIELIPSIEHTSLIHGDGAGFDIKSFNEKGDSIYIEVKSTEGPLNNPIYFSKNELDMMKQLGESYFLYRVHNLNSESKTGSISIYSGYNNITDNFYFIPETVKAKLK
jgi:hypothetical protein